jgi:hypothetical protein
MFALLSGVGRARRLPAGLPGAAGARLPAPAPPGRQPHPAARRHQRLGSGGRAREGNTEGEGGWESQGKGMVEGAGAARAARGSGRCTCTRHADALLCCGQRSRPASLLVVVRRRRARQLRLPVGRAAGDAAAGRARARRRRARRVRAVPRPAPRRAGHPGAPVARHSPLRPCALDIRTPGLWRRRCCHLRDGLCTPTLRATRTASPPPWANLAALWPALHVLSHPLY